jgi:hypothetical protein
MERDLEAKTSGLKRFNQVAVGRELEMIELKKRSINGCLREVGIRPRC